MEETARMTLEEIAKAIGISRTTIYKVLRNKGNVSSETRRVVEQALEKYHYVQNRNARNLAMNRHYVIGYVGFRSKSANYFATQVKKGLHRAAKELGDDGLTMLISEFDVSEPKEQLKAVEEMLEQGATHFIIAYSHSSIMQEILTQLQERKCRVVLLSRDFHGNAGSYVGVDYYKSGRLAADLMGKMLPQGGKIFIPITEEYRTNGDILARLSGFQDKIKEYSGVGPLETAYGLSGEEEIRRKVSECISLSEDVKGIFDLTYRLDVIAGVLKELGREDIRLIGFDLFEEIRDYVADATIDAVVYQDLSMQAYQAVKLLFDEMCYGKYREQQKYYAKLEVIVQENINYFN